MVGACAAHVPVRSIPAHVIDLRGGRRLSPGVPRGPESLQAGDEIEVSPHAAFAFTLAGNRVRVAAGRASLRCVPPVRGAGFVLAGQGTLGVGLQSGRVSVRVGDAPASALVTSREMIVYPKLAGTRFVVERRPRARATRAWTLNSEIVAASTADPALRINTRITYTAIS
ncbi:MAG: hypothetical protein WAK93_07250, partial [Solirubrobacteraceae bacterium]